MCIIKIRLFHIQEKILVESYTLSFLCHFWVLCCHFQLKLAVFLISNTLISTNLQLHPEYIKPKSPNKKKLKRKARVILLVTSQITIKFLITLIFISIFTFSKKWKTNILFWNLINASEEKMKLNFLTLSSISFVWAAERQNLARDSMIGVAGKPTTTIPSPLFKHSLLRQLKHNKFHVLFRTNAIISNKNKYVSLISQIND